MLQITHRPLHRILSGRLCPSLRPICPHHFGFGPSTHRRRPVLTDFQILGYQLLAPDRKEVQNSDQIKNKQPATIKLSQPHNFQSELITVIASLS